jgi:hypothetical protein
MATKTITSANAKFTITVLGAALGPFTLAGYAAESMFLSEVREATQTVVGADGSVATGYVPALTPLQVTLLANSESNGFFEQWLGLMKTLKEAFVGQAVIDIPSIQKSYVVSHLALQSVTEIPPAGKTLQQMQYNLMAGDIQVLPLPVAA